MANLNDIFNKKKLNQENQFVEVDGMCEECYWPLDHGYYDAKNKKLKIVCLNNHERTIDWDMNG
jgi:hypothetical protein